MVVGAVIKGFVLVHKKSGTDVHRLRVRRSVQVTDPQAFVGAGRTRGKPVPPNGGGGGDQSEVNGHLRVLAKRVEESNVFFQLLPVRLIDAGDQRVVCGKVDAVILLLAAQPLAPCAQRHPLLAQCNVVGNVGFALVHKASVHDALEGEDGRGGEIAVLLRRKGLLGKEQAQKRHAAEKDAEKRRDDAGIGLLHAPPPFSEAEI